MSSDATSPTDSYAFSSDAAVRELVLDACTRIESEFSRCAPFLARDVSAWMATLSPTGKAPDYFLQPQSFPLVRLIWWAATRFASEADTEFLADVVYSTLNGYYYIRLLDNLMDGHDTIELRILAATAFFHTEFLATYQKYFDASHRFWQTFRTAWFSASDAVAHELTLHDIQWNDFETISVKKLSAARIPIAAIAYYHNASERLSYWDKFTSALARWSQLQDDLFDWRGDLHHGKPSYFLTEAKRHPEFQSGEAWIISRGFQQGLERLLRQLSVLYRFALPLHCPDVVRYLVYREAMLQREKAALVQGLQALVDLASVVDSGL